VPAEVFPVAEIQSPRVEGQAAGHQ
jgi:hypothetical protein